MQVYECIFSLITGVGVFILAMKIMSESLKELAGERMRSLLEKLARNRITGVLIGALATTIIQSSSATTVMVIGFVNADVMSLNQAASIIIGSNIGTTATGILASLESLNISLYLSMLVFIGVMLSFVKKLKKVANLLTGLGMIFVGLRLMSNACNDDSIKTSFSDILQKISFPLLLELLGIIFTAIIQSSSAMTGIVIVMVGKEVMTMDSGLFITLGANVGTCITALIGIIGANINSKRTAVIHLIFNICGVILFTPILWIFKKEILDILESIVSNQSMQIAYFHLFFNITTAIVTTPLIDFLVKIAKKVVSDKKPDHLIEETMEEKEKFAIRRDTSTSNIYFDDISTSRNLNENTLNDINYEIDENQYEPPIILDNYFIYKEDKKGNIIENDNDNDNFSENNEEENKEKENVELIDVKEDNKNEIKNKVEENIDNEDKIEKKMNESNIINAKEKEKEDDKDNEKKNEDNNNKDNKDNKDNIIIENKKEELEEVQKEQDIKEETTNKDEGEKDKNEEEFKNGIKEHIIDKNKDEQIDKDIEKEKEKENILNKRNLNKDEEKDYQQIEVNMEGYEEPKYRENYKNE